MSISTHLQLERIKEYANLCLKIYDLEMEVSQFRDELTNLAANMSQEDINEANILLRKKMSQNG